jgi:isocitrate dehydrogenase
MDTRGSHFYLALYWAQTLADQSQDRELQSTFSTVAQKLQGAEAQIVRELNETQGRAVNIGGYYHPDEALTTKAMRPSTTFNAVLDAIR